MRILICEDSEQNLQSAREFAEKVKGEHEVVIYEQAAPAGYKVSSSGRETGSVHQGGRVISVTYGEKVDCVLTDLYMPTRKGTTLPGGLYVALAALQLGIPACIITDGDAHGGDELISNLSLVLQTENERLQVFLIGKEDQRGIKGTTPEGKLIKDWEYCFQSLMRKQA